MFFKPMPHHQVRETCPCGAKLSVSTYIGQVADEAQRRFEAAHHRCREAARKSVLVNPVEDGEG